MQEVRENPKPVPKPPLRGIRVGSDAYFSIGFYLKKSFSPGRLVVLQQGEGEELFADRVAQGNGGSFSLSKGEVDELIAGLQELRAQL